MTTYIQAVLNVHVVKTCNINSQKMWVKKRKQCISWYCFFFHLIFQLCQEAYVFSWVHALSSIAGAVLWRKCVMKSSINVKLKHVNRDHRHYSLLDIAFVAYTKSPWYYKAFNSEPIFRETCRTTHSHEERYKSQDL